MFATDGNFVLGEHYLSHIGVRLQISLSFNLASLQIVLQDIVGSGDDELVFLSAVEQSEDLDFVREPENLFFVIANCLLQMNFRP